MKKKLLPLLCLVQLIFLTRSIGQNVSINNTGNAADNSAMLDITATDKGILIPRMTQAQRTAILSPAEGLLVYQTDGSKGFYFYNAATTVWTLLAANGNLWSLTGNSGSLWNTNFLGTTDLQSLRIKTNSIQRFYVDSLGSVGIGTSPSFTAGISRERFLVDAGSTSSNPTASGAFNVISGKGYIDSYLQLNIQNNSPTSGASSDIVASNDAATEGVNFIDMGINSSAYNPGGVLGGPSTAYLYATGNDFSIGNATSGKNLILFTGGTNPSNEAMRIDGTGNVGIGTTAPSTKLHISGANPLTLMGVVNGTNTSTDSLLTITSGLVRKLPLSTFSGANAITTTSTSLTLDATYYTVIITANGAAITLPPANTCAKRIYIIVNETSSVCVLKVTNSIGYQSFSGLNTTTIGANMSVTIQSDGTNWYRIQ